MLKKQLSLFQYYIYSAKICLLHICERSLLHGVGHILYSVFRFVSVMEFVEVLRKRYRYNAIADIISEPYCVAEGIGGESDIAITL